MSRPNLTPEILTAALRGLEAQKAQIESAIDEVRRRLGIRLPEPAAAAKAPNPKRKLSAAAVKRIVAAQKKRWAEYRKKAEAEQKARLPAAATKAPRPKRKMSAAGRKRIADAARKRWTEYRRKQAEVAKSAGKPAVMKRAAQKKAAAKKRTKQTAATGPKTVLAEAVTQPAAAGVSE